MSRAEVCAVEMNFFQTAGIRGGLRGLQILAQRGHARERAPPFVTICPSFNAVPAWEKLLRPAIFAASARPWIGLPLRVISRITAAGPSRPHTLAAGFPFQFNFVERAADAGVEQFDQVIFQARQIKPASPGRRKAAR